MPKVVTTISIDSDVKEAVQKILKEEGFTLSYVIERKLKEYIDEYERRFSNGTI